MSTPRIIGLSLVALGTIFLPGCKGVDDSLMPMTVGKSWKYSISAGFDSYVLPVKVVRELSVANTRGFELSGPLGTSRLAWTETGLVAERLNNTQFIPPLPLVSNVDNDKGTRWKGRVINADRTTAATALQVQSNDPDTMIGVQKTATVRSTVNLKMGASELELITWFQSGQGIVMQEQRTDNRLLVRLSILEN